MIAHINAQIIFFAWQKLIAVTIVFRLLYQCTIMTEITLNITLYGSTCKIIKTSYSIMIAYDIHQLYFTNYTNVSICQNSL